MKKYLVSLSKKFPLTRKVRHFYVINRNKFLRQFYKLYKINDKVIIFESFNGRSYSDSPRALYEQILEDPFFDDYQFIWAFRKPKKYRFLKENPRTTTVKYRTPRYYKTFATAKYWIVNAMIPLQTNKKKGQIMVQCWHGTPLKRLRNDIVEDTKNAMNSLEDFKRKNDLDTVRYDFFISPSPFASEKFTSAFALEKLGKKDILIETGYPRNDILLNHDQQKVAEIKEKLQIPSGKKVLLYAPTWRDDLHDDSLGYVYEPPISFKKMREKLGQDWVILFRSHYLIGNKLDFSEYENFVYNVSKYDDVAELFLVSDALMTDYSSVMFDFANLNRPMIFYMYDKEYYEQQLRGFYFDISELPGDILSEEKDVIDALAGIENYAKKHEVKYKKFAKKFTELDDGKASERVLREVFKNVAE